MFESLGGTFGQMREVFAGLSATRKLLALGGVALLIAGFVVLFMWANQTEYAPAYSQLSQEDAGAVLAKLKERKTPFRLTDGGSTILVPREVVEETRLFLATEGLPAGGAIGMEVFNENHLGTTDFVQRLNYQRALQGELERTIKKFQVIDQVRVHINIPKESLFIEEERPPSASIVIKLNQGKSLTKSQLEGIVHLVASSVEGLKAENISVVDTQGGLLYSQDKEAESSMVSETQTAYKRNYEKNLGDRLTTMLERMVGPGKAMTRVTADFNFEQINTTEEIYDPDRSAIRSEQRFNETTTGPARGASGVPNARYDLGTRQDEQGQDDQNQEKFAKSEETTNYEITKINRRITSPGGSLNRLSVAVMVDGTYKEEEVDGKPVRTFVPRSQAELTKMEDLVRSAAGFNEARGDTVVVSSVPFYLGEEEAPAGMVSTVMDYARQFGRPVFNVLLIVLFFLFVVRPLMSWVKKEAGPMAAALPAPEEREALPGREAAPAIPEFKKEEPGRLDREQILALARQDPEKTTNLLRSWIDQR